MCSMDSHQKKGLYCRRRNISFTVWFWSLAYSLLLLKFRLELDFFLEDLVVYGTSSSGQYSSIPENEEIYIFSDLNTMFDNILWRVWQWTLKIQYIFNSRRWDRSRILFFKVDFRGKPSKHHSILISKLILLTTKLFFAENVAGATDFYFLTENGLKRISKTKRIQKGKDFFSFLLYCISRQASNIKLSEDHLYDLLPTCTIWLDLWCYCKNFRVPAFAVFLFSYGFWLYFSQMK